MESFLGRNQFRPPGQPGQFERQLVGLGAGIAEKHPGFRLAAEQADQRLGQRNTRFGGIQVRGVSQRRHLSRDGLDDRGVTMAKDVDGDAAEQVQIGLSVHIGDHGTVAAGQRDRRDAVVVHHHRGPPLLHRFGVRHGPTTFVPAPSSVSNSTSTQCSMRPSTICALGTPVSTARRHASILGIIPVSNVGSSCDSVAVSISLTSESRSGHRVYRPSISVSISSFSAPSASASAAAAVSALMLWTTPSTSGASVDTTGIRLAAIKSSTTAAFTQATLPTSPMSVSTPSTVTLRRTAVNMLASSPVIPTAYGPWTLIRLTSSRPTWPNNTIRATSSTSGVVTRKPPLKSPTMPSRCSMALICGPPPCTTTG